MTLGLLPLSYEFDRERCSTIPIALKQRRQWVCWQARDRIDKRSGEITGLDKIPIDPKTNPPRHARINQPASWGAFQQCIDTLPTLFKQWRRDDPKGYRGGGIGYVFTSDDRFVGIDLDKIRDASTSIVAPWARQLIHHLGSYAEVSPSGTGVKLFCQGVLPGSGVKKHHLELYDQRRFFTVTGWHLDGTPSTIEARQREIDALYRGYAILEAALTRYGERFGHLFAGQWSQVDDQNGARFLASRRRIKASATSRPTSARRPSKSTRSCA